MQNNKQKLAVTHLIERVINRQTTSQSRPNTHIKLRCFTSVQLYNAASVFVRSALKHSGLISPVVRCERGREASGSERSIYQHCGVTPISHSPDCVWTDGSSLHYSHLTNVLVCEPVCVCVCVHVCVTVMDTMPPFIREPIHYVWCNLTIMKSPPDKINSGVNMILCTCYCRKTSID